MAAAGGDGGDAAGGEAAQEAAAQAGLDIRRDAAVSGRGVSLRGLSQCDIGQGCRCGFRGDLRDRVRRCSGRVGDRIKEEGFDL